MASHVWKLKGISNTGNMVFKLQMVIKGPIMIKIISNTNNEGFIKYSK